VGTPARHSPASRGSPASRPTTTHPVVWADDRAAPPCAQGTSRIARPRSRRVGASGHRDRATRAGARETLALRWHRALALTSIHRTPPSRWPQQARRVVPGVCASTLPRIAVASIDRSAAAS
jgi:hypothetical protein